MRGRVRGFGFVLIRLFCRAAENSGTGLGPCLSRRANDSGEKVTPWQEIPGQQMDSVQVVAVASGWAENFGKGILLSLTRGARSSEGKKVSPRTYKSSVMQTVSEVQGFSSLFSNTFFKTKYLEYV